MLKHDLQDLVMAGVRWELSETPFAMECAPQPSHMGDSETDLPNERRTHTSIVPPIAPTQSVSCDTAVAMAARPTDTDSLNRMISEFNHPLRNGATNTVLGHIAPNPNGVVIITDIPSSDDDASGHILSGAAGEMLDKMLVAIGMSRDNVSILPLVFWRTPGGRTPSRHELDLTRPFVNRMLELLNPHIIITLGALPASEIGNITLPRGHGVITEHTSGAKIMPIYHPNYLMLKSTAKRDVWNALQTVQNMLKCADK